MVGEVGLVWLKTVGIVACLRKSLHLHFNGKLKYGRELYLSACLLMNFIISLE
jgi:hypothetical protein